MKDKNKDNKPSPYMHEDDFDGIDPSRGMKKDRRRARRQQEKQNLKNVYDPKDWDDLDMEDYYDRCQ